MRKFKVTVKFDLKNERVVNCLMINFDLDNMDDEGVIEMWYTSKGNSTSTEETAMKGMRKILNSFPSLKRGFTILGAREVQKGEER